MARRKAALVTGSTSGIGLAIAMRLAADGYNIMLNSLEPEEQITGAISAVKKVAKGGVAYIQADLALEQGTDLVIDTIAHFGRIDVLVNNAGIQKVSRIEDFLQEDWEHVRAIILDGAFHTIRAAVPDMLSRKWGRIINIASAHALVASPFKSAYVAAKHGLLGLTKTVALEVAESSITVNAICPGYVFTPLVEKQMKDQAQVHAMSEDQVRRNIMLAPQPTKQFVQVEEIASMASYLCGDMARSITGTSIAIDGGWTAH